MLFAFLCFDKPNSAEVRAKARPDHLAWIGGCGRTIQYAGPMMTDDGQTPIGSLIVIECENIDEARSFQKTDPYVQAGLFGNVMIHPTRKVHPAS